MQRAAVTLGKACISIRHMLDPELIVLGGGVIEACGDFLLPRIKQIFDSDPFFSKKIGACPILASQLGDDAIILGAAALLQHPLQAPVSLMHKPLPLQIQANRAGQVTIHNKIYRHDIYILPDGKIKKRNKKMAKRFLGTPDKLGPQELEKLYRKNPEAIIIGTGYKRHLSVTLPARQFLKNQGIEFKILPTAQAIALFNKTFQRKAVFLHID